MAQRGVVPSSQLGSCQGTSSQVVLSTQTQQPSLTTEVAPSPHCGLIMLQSGSGSVAQPCGRHRATQSVHVGQDEPPQGSQ